MGKEGDGEAQTETESQSEKNKGKRQKLGEGHLLPFQYPQGSLVQPFILSKCLFIFARNVS